MDIELQCVKCKKRSSPETAYRRAKHPGLCMCGGGFRITSMRYAGTKPVATTPDEAVECPNCGTVLFGRAEPLPPAHFPAWASSE